MNPIKHNYLLFCLFCTVSVIPIKGVVQSSRVQHMGPYTIYPLSFWFLSAAFLNEKFDHYEIFLSAFAPASSKLISCVFFPQKETQSLYNLSMFDFLEMGKLMLNALLAVLLSPEQGGLMTFSCRAACFVSGRHVGCFQFHRWHFLRQIFWHHSLHRQKPLTGELGLQSWGTFSEENSKRFFF